MEWFRFLPLDGWLREPLSVIAAVVLVVCFLTWLPRALRHLCAEWGAALEPLCASLGRLFSRLLNTLRARDVFGLDRRHATCDRRQRDMRFRLREQRHLVRRREDRIETTLISA